MSASFTWRGGSPDETSEALHEGVVQGMVGVALVMQKLVRKQLSQRGTGRLYGVWKKKRKKGRNLRSRGWHQASAPGEPPAANTGRLRASWTLIPPEKVGAATTQDQGFAYIEQTRNKSTLYTLGTNLVYARAMEYGHGKIAPRPYIRPVLKAVEPKVADIMQKMMARTLKGKR
jgi:hypothetical protein